MRKKLFIIAFIFSLSVNCAALFTIAYQVWQRRTEGPVRTSLILRDLNGELTERQREQIRSLREEAKARADQLNDALLRQRELLIEELRMPPPDHEKIDQLLRDISRMQFELEREVVEDLLRMSEMMPPGYRESLLRMMRQNLKDARSFRTPDHRTDPEDDGKR